MERQGRAHVFGDNINTDYVISAHRKEQHQDFEAMAKFIFEDIAPGFAAKLAPGDFIVAGENFGCGSSREAAPAVIKAAGIGGVLAKSFARIFYRNAVNVGLPILEVDTDGIEDGDRLTVDFRTGTVVVEGRGVVKQGRTLPAFMLEILSAGGLLEFFEKHRGFVIPGVGEK